MSTVDQCQCCGEFKELAEGSDVCPPCVVLIADFDERLARGETCMCAWFCRCGRNPPSEQEMEMHTLALGLAHEYLTIERATDEMS